VPRTPDSTYEQILRTVCLLSLLSLLSLKAAEAQTVTKTITKTYTADDSLFPNPERGFYYPYSPPGGGIPGQMDTPHPPLVADELRALRQRPEGISLIRDLILIPSQVLG
jgi:hypothetical protein